MKTLPVGRLLGRVKHSLSETPPDEGGVILSEVQAKAFYNAFVKHIQQAVAAGDKVNLAGLAIFTVEEKDERTARNPRTGEPVLIPRRHVIKIKASRELKNAAAASLPEGENLQDDDGGDEE